METHTKPGVRATKSFSPAAARLAPDSPTKLPALEHWSEPASTRPIPTLVPLREIDLGDDSFQYRVRIGPIVSLEESMDRDGQREPIDVRCGPPYVVIDGFRRIAALQRLGRSEVLAIVHQNLSIDDAHRLSFVKNVVRRNLTPLERAHALFKMKQRLASLDAGARALGISAKQARRYLALLSFPPEIRKFLDLGRLKMAHARVLADWNVTDVSNWIERVESNRWSAPALRRELRAADGHSQPGRKKLYLKLTPDGFRMYPFSIRSDAPAGERAKVVELLRSAIKVLGGAK